MHAAALEDSHEPDSPVQTISPANDAVRLQTNHDMLALMDCLQCNGVEPGVAANVASAIAMVKPRFAQLRSRMVTAKKWLHPSPTSAQPSLTFTEGVQVYRQRTVARQTSMCNGVWTPSTCAHAKQSVHIGISMWLLTAIWVDN